MDVEKKGEKGEEEFKMEFNVLENKNNYLKFEISGINEGEANYLRRLVISETPVMAIEEVEFLKNDSGLYDEVLANRLGLIPLTTDLNSYNFLNECNCKNEGCAKCQVQGTLELKGPITVYGGDLNFKDEAIKSVYEKIPIVKLLEGQELKIIVNARLGVGKDHVKNNPAAMFYTNKPILNINNKSKKLDKLKSKFPKKAFKEGKLDHENLLKNNLFESCEGIDEDILKIDYEKDKFIFTLESFGQLSPAEILEAAIDMSNKKLDDFIKSLNSVKPTTIKTLAKKITG